MRQRVLVTAGATGIRLEIVRAFCEVKRVRFPASPADYLRGNRPTIALSEIGSVRRVRGAGGDLANRKPGIL